MLIPQVIDMFKKDYDYSLATLKADALAGVTVGIVAIPLAIAFAIASGVEPHRGIATAIIAGFLGSLLGGSRTSISGPTGAFIVVLFTIVERFGYEGLALATLMAGVMLMALGFLRLGRFIEHIPPTVIVGFTAGIALIIFTGQIGNFFGLTLPSTPPDVPHKWLAYAQHASTFAPATTAVGLFTLLLMVFLRQLPPHLRPPFPVPIIGVIVASFVAWRLGLPVETIGTRFGGIPQQLPQFQGAQLFAGFTSSRLIELLPSAFSIMLLCGIESLLCCLVADRLTNQKHRPNTELVAQGVANIASSLFGGIAATGAIARTGVNINAGGRTPIAGIIHALFILLTVLLLAPLAAFIPMATLAAVLVMVSWDMSERKNIAKILRGRKRDAVVMMTTFSVTVLIDLTQAVLIGTAMAALIRFTPPSKKA